MLLVLAGEARSDTVVFSDDFSTSPDAGGQWTIHRRTPDAANEASWDSAEGVLYLTRPASDRATAIFASRALTEHAWNATFKFRTGGGGSGLVGPPLAGLLGPGADGFVFMFYKDPQPYASSPPSPGSDLGFTTSSGPVSGYGIAFNEWRGNAVRLIKDTADNALAAATDARVADNAWHTATIQFHDGRVKVGIDGDAVLDATIPTVDYAHSGVGFSGATGGNTNNHVIDDFQLSASTAAPVATRDDDGTMEASLDFDYTDDTAYKDVLIGSGDFSLATSAKLWIYAQGQNCDAAGGTQTLHANGAHVATYDPCALWPAASFGWASIDIPLSSLTAGAANRFQAYDSGVTWIDRGSFFGIDTDHDHGRSAAIRNFGTDNPPAGELMWYLAIAT